MLCPVCNVDLLLSERSGVEIDYCPKCRGVWLDRGELDKIIERNNAMTDCKDDKYDSSRNGRKDDYRYDYRYNKPKKKESFLSELFDF